MIKEPNREIIKRLVDAAREAETELGPEVTRLCEKRDAEGRPSDNFSDPFNLGGPIVAPSSALRHAVQALPFILQIFANERFPIAMDRWKAAIDLSMGDSLPFTAAQFDEFCDGSAINNPTEEILFKFRQKMLSKLAEILKDIPRGEN